jgi:hypothetical protein
MTSNTDYFRKQLDKYLELELKPRSPSHPSWKGPTKLDGSVLDQGLPVNDLSTLYSLSVDMIFDMDQVEFEHERALVRIQCRHEKQYRDAGVWDLISRKTDAQEVIKLYQQNKVVYERFLEMSVEGPTYWRKFHEALLTSLWIKEQNDWLLQMEGGEWPFYGVDGNKVLTRKKDKVAYRADLLAFFAERLRYLQEELKIDIGLVSSLIAQWDPSKNSQRDLWAMTDQYQRH